MRYKVMLALVLTVTGIGYVNRDRLMPFLLDAKNADAATSSRGRSDDVANEGVVGNDKGGHAGKVEKGGNGKDERAVSVTVAVATAGALPVQRTAVGIVVPFASTALSSVMSGTIAKILVADGEEVKAGDLLVQLDDRTIQANIRRDTAVLAKDQAVLDEAETTLKRVQALAGAGAETQQQYDDAAAAANEARATIAVDEANLAADRVALTQTQIRAPFDGKLGVVSSSIGAVVAPGGAIVTITQMKPVYAEFALPETDLDLMRGSLAAGTLGVRISPSLSNADARMIAGPIVFIDNAVDIASGTFTLRARLDNSDGALWPGQALDVTVQAGERSDLALVPAVAVQPQGDGSLCFVVGNDKTVTVRRVEVALMAGDTAGISSGIQVGERVVTEGQAGLVDGARVSIVPVQIPDRISDTDASKTGSPAKASTAGGVAP